MALSSLTRSPPTRGLARCFMVRKALALDSSTSARRDWLPAAARCLPLTPAITPITLELLLATKLVPRGHSGFTADPLLPGFRAMLSPCSPCVGPLPPS